jgi:hypothetical protein
VWYTPGSLPVRALISAEYLSACRLEFDLDLVAQIYVVLHGDAGLRYGQTCQRP